MAIKNLLDLPPDLPVPLDDGACQHLVGSKLPSISLISTANKTVNLSQENGKIVVYVFPMIGRPDAPPMLGWNAIPGARGCTPQSCAFRDIYADFKKLDIPIYGLSVQSTSDQQEAARRLHLPFTLLSDAQLQFAKALSLPTFDYNGSHYVKRLTLIIQNGVISKVFYPIFPPNQNASDVLDWFKSLPRHD